MVRRANEARRSAGKAGSQAPRHPSARKKTLRLDQDLLDQARRALGARTETDAVTQALEAVVRRERQAQGIRALGSLGPIDITRIE